MAADTSFSLLTGNSIETRRVRAGGVIFREGEQSDSPGTGVDACPDRSARVGRT